MEEQFNYIIKKCDEFLTAITAKNSDTIDGLAFSAQSIQYFTQNIYQKNLIENYFTGTELEYAKNRLPSLCGRYAAKSAVRLALHEELDWKKINILSTRLSQPFVASKPNITISITHEGDLAASIAGIIKGKNKLGIGLDAVLISRFSRILTEHPKILNKIFTLNELDEINDREIIAAEKWAAKEAVSKALGTGIWSGSSLHEIEILTFHDHQKAYLKSGSLERSRELGFNNWILNFIHDHEFILALVIAQS